MPENSAKAIIVDAVTGEVVERPLTSDEIAAQKAMQAAYLVTKSEEEAKTSARESALAKLAALGLTEAEIAAL